MKELKNYLETGERKAKKQIELAKILGISDVNIRMAKAGKRGLPVEACILLADYIEADRLEVIAASNLVTEKDDRKRKIFESCFKQVASVATVVFVIFILTLTPTSPAYAASELTVYNNTNYWQLVRSVLEAFYTEELPVLIQ